MDGVLPSVAAPEREAARRLSAPALAKGMQPAALHAYTDQSGAPLYWRIRCKHPVSGEKWIRPMWFDGERFAIGEPTHPEAGKPLYRLHDLATASPERTVVLVEGESCADRLAERGLIATTSGSSTSAKDADWTPLAGRSVVIWPDADPQGRRYAEDACARLRGIGCTVRLVDVGALGLPLKGDAVDWLAEHPAATPDDVLGLPMLAEAASSNTALREAIRPLPDALLPVEPFPVDLMPGVFGEWIGDVSERMQCPADFVALPMLVAAGSLVARHCDVRPKRADAWSESPNIWGCIVGSPGAMKSPSLTAALDPIKRLERSARDDHASRLSEFEQSQQIEQIRRDAAKQQAKDAARKNPSADLARFFEGQEAAEAPREERFIVNDVTVEKLGEILQDNPGGVLYYRDELGSLLRALSREEKVGERGFLLSAWSGADHRWDRIGRGSTITSHALVSLVGGIQPGPLSALVREASGSGDDGLLQRFLFVWPDRDVSEWSDCDRIPNLRARDALSALFVKLATNGSVGAMRDDVLGPERPFLRLSGDASEAFTEWRRDLEGKLRSGDTPETLEAALSKFRKQVPALALILHSVTPEEAGAGVISVATMERALALGEYFESHTRRVFDSGRRPVINAAQAILGRLRRRDLEPTGFTAREVYRQSWSGLSDRDVVQGALDLLCDYGHLVGTPMDTGGRPSVVYVLAGGGG